MAADEDKARIGGVHVPDYIRPQYANFVNVNFTPWDFRFVFALVKVPIPGAEQERVSAEDMELHPEAVAEMIIPANLMHGLIGAMQTTFSQYLEQFGPPGLDPEGPRAPEE